MLSILIPTYNYNITPLVGELHKQAISLNIIFEILVMEDGSTLFVEENQEIGKLEHCKHIILTENIGRSAIRNKLADSAKHQFLLFADCDAEVQNVNFIANYLPFCEDDAVIIGGTAYDPNNHDPAYSLRLKYGRAREANTDYIKGQKGYENFTTFNFLIDKKVFDKVRFDVKITGYGHEDTLFGHALHEQGYSFQRINNPLIHKGLDDNESFLRKTIESVKNLYLLYISGKYPFLAEESKLLRTFIKLKQFKLVRLMSLKLKLSKPILERNLKSEHPSLFYYDIYKLAWICYFYVHADKLSD
ncbi:MAG: Glycosyl transferase family 2 [Bacteroidetes bacterium ADurb.Bin174]|nr:MAG: Glycosyl transferase family 2 [Bacteroidetes bacterium ADurb.Bin174]